MFFARFANFNVDTVSSIAFVKRRKEEEVNEQIEGGKEGSKERRKEGKKEGRKEGREDEEV